MLTQTTRAPMMQLSLHQVHDSSTMCNVQELSYQLADKQNTGHQRHGSKPGMAATGRSHSPCLV